MPKKNEQQQDMFGHFNPRVGRMRKLRKLRREAGFTECNVWIPEDAKEDLKKYAKKLIQKSGKSLPTADR